MSLKNIEEKLISTFFQTRRNFVVLIFMNWLYLAAKKRQLLYVSTDGLVFETESKKIERLLEV